MHRRIMLSWCALAGVAALTTAAALTGAGEQDVRFWPGAGHDLVVAGSTRPGWVPSAADWEQGRPEAYRIGLDPAARELGPGGVLELRVAARHGAHDAPSEVRLAVTDPDDRGARTDPRTGSRLELFDQLHLLVVDAATGEVLVDAGPGSTAESRSARWGGVWQPGEVRLVDITVTVPEELTDAWQGAVTDIQVDLVSESV
ncbi:MAG: hypothetical protein IE923_02610 [Micrococcales bacterium]|nr:hypothetical protein [Micrococcales bacterium]